MKQKLLKTFKLFCRYLLFGLLTQTIFIQTLSASVKGRADIEISGKVVDENGESLPGASITVKGTSTGTVTDVDGNYKLIADESAVLIFSFIGYMSVEEPVGGRSEINVFLDPDITTLSEVIVTGYQTLSRERVSGSFETLKGDVLAQRPTANFLDKLEGIASGVSLEKDANGDKIVQIRGRSTIQANASPLYVVDGFPMSGSTLSVNPEDIESITILKDAAAASIWGVRASNGVIVITTKKGSRKGTKIGFSSYIEVTEPVDYAKQNWLTTTEEVDMQQEWFDKGWYKALSSELGGHNAMDQMEMANIYLRGDAPDGEVWSQQTYDAFVADLKTKDLLKDWEENMLQNAVKQTYNFSIASGSENNDIYASLVYNTNKSYSVGNTNDRFVLNVKDEFRLGDRFTFNAGINTSMRNNVDNGYEANAVEQQRAYKDLVDEYGRTVQYYENFDPWVSREKEAIDGYFPYTFNRLDEMRNSDNTRQRVDIRAQFGIGVKIIEGLRFDTRFQYEIGFDNRDDYRTMDLPSQKIHVNDFYLPDQVDANGDVIDYQVPIGTKYIYNKNDYKAWDWRNTLTFQKSWSVHDINAFGGIEIRKHVKDNLKGTLYGYDKQTTQYVPVNEQLFRSGQIRTWNKGGASSAPFTVISDDDIRELSFFSNVGYTFNDKYSATGSFRVDQKNLFGSDPEFRYKPLWSAGASWQIIKEGFMSGITMLNRLTLRATYGISGNASNEYSPYAQAVNRIDTDGRKIFDYLELTDPANDKLKWEETATMNIGVDFSLWNNRFGGSIEYYSRNSRDLLGERPLDPTNGFAYATINYASMSNNGVDLTFTGTILKTTDWSWDARLLFSYNKNLITEVANENIVPNLLAKNGALRVGQPLDNIYSFDYAGLNNFGDVMINTAENGEVMWRDYRGFEKEEDLIYHGTSTAPVYGGLSTTVRYKGFDLAVNLSYKAGYNFKQYTGVGVAGFYYNKRMNSIWRDRWQKPGDENTTRVPKLHYYGTNPLSGVSEDWWDNYDADWYWQDSQDFVFDGGFVRVKDIIIGYNTPKKLLSRTPVESIRLTIQITNPLLWVANDQGIDPEAIDGVNETPTGGDDFWREGLYRRSTAAWTNLKSITFGLRATF